MSGGNEIGGLGRTEAEQDPSRLLGAGELVTPEDLPEETLAGAKVERRLKIKVIALVVFAFVLLFGGIFVWSALRAEAYRQQQEDNYNELNLALSELYEDFAHEVPRDELSMSQIMETEAKLGAIELERLQEGKEEIARRLGSLKDFVLLRERMEKCFVGEVLKLETEGKEIEEIKQKYGELGEGYKKPLANRFGTLVAQYDEMGNLGSAIKDLFADEEQGTVKTEVTRTVYDELVGRASALPQQELREKYQAQLAKVDRVLVQREQAAAEARRRAAEARRRAEELRRQREKEIAEAWRVINLPTYHSQNLQAIYNGCEAASLLMALQCRGQLGGVDLKSYAEMMPKSNDPYTGFYGSIYDLSPDDAFWIAPGPLAQFGRESSGYANVVDISGASLAELDQEVAAGNPVVIYISFAFNPLKYWVSGAPKNLHVMVLTGYNEATGTQHFVDPWTLDGGRTWDVPRSEVEKIYDAVGRKAVVVR